MHIDMEVIKRYLITSIAKDLLEYTELKIGKEESNNCSAILDFRGIDKDIRDSCVHVICTLTKEQSIHCQPEIIGCSLIHKSDIDGEGVECFMLDVKDSIKGNYIDLAIATCVAFLINDCNYRTPYQEILYSELMAMLVFDESNSTDRCKNRYLFYDKVSSESQFLEKLGNNENMSVIPEELESSILRILKDIVSLIGRVVGDCSDILRASVDRLIMSRIITATNPRQFGYIIEEEFKGYSGYDSPSDFLQLRSNSSKIILVYWLRNNSFSPDEPGYIPDIKTLIDRWIDGCLRDKDVDMIKEYRNIYEDLYIKSEPVDAEHNRQLQNYYAALLVVLEVLSDKEYYYRNVNKRGCVCNG